ncbi:MAG TPA: antibiotic biosynthesis monooxygenase [Anaerolineales bacterium]|nr:antibiotic biosynthesis monooxygenase [Anaerolineales bacterium]
MIMTILEGRVAKENWPALEQVYKKGAQEEQPGLVRSYLIHSIKESDLWRILTIWTSREALEAMRRSTETPAGVLMFRTAQSEPVLTIYEIAQEIIQK